MATSEIDRSDGLPIYIQNFTDNIQQMLHDVGGKSLLMVFNQHHNKGMPTD